MHIAITCHAHTLPSHMQRSNAYSYYYITSKYLTVIPYRFHGLHFITANTGLFDINKLDSIAQVGVPAVVNLGSDYGVRKV